MNYFVKQSEKGKELFAVSVDYEKLYQLRCHIIDKYGVSVFRSVSELTRNMSELEYAKMMVGLSARGYYYPKSFEKDVYYEEVQYPSIIEVIDNILAMNLEMINKVLNINEKSKVKDRKLLPYYLKLKNFITLTKVNNMQHSEKDIIFDFNPNLKMRESLVKRLEKKFVGKKKD